MWIRIAALPLLLLAAPASAQSPPAAPPATVPAEDLVKVALETSAGKIVLALDRGRAPVTTANFLAYVDKRWLDGQTIYRAMRYGDGGLIQGGVRDGAKLLPPIKHEGTLTTGIRNVAGTIAMANAGPGTARNDFFILTTDIPAFDEQPGQPGFAAFGRVIEGMEVVKAILAAPVSATLGEGPMKGQMLDPPVKITRAARTK